MRDLIVALVILGSLPMILARPYIGILVWSWIGYMNPHRLAWGFMYDFPVAMLVGVTTIVAFLVSREPKRLPWTPVTVLMLSFVVWMNFTTLFALNPAEAYPQWDKVMKIQLMTFLTLMLMQSRERIQLLVWVIALSIGFFGIKGGVFTVTRGGEFMVLGPPMSFISGNTEIALALTMMLPLFRYLQLSTERRWMRWGLGVCMVLMAFSIIGSYSRGAFLAGAAMALFLFLKSRKKLLLGSAMVLSIPAMVAFMPAEWAERMETIQNYQDDGSAMGRINAWWFAYNLASERPIIGGGFEAFTPELFHRWAPDPEDFHDAHSIYFQVLAEHGYVGLALFLGIFFLAWRAGSWTIRQARARPDIKWAGDLAAMTQVALVGYAVGGAFLGLAYFDLFYHLVVILVLTKLWVQRVLAGVEEAGAGPALTAAQPRLPQVFGDFVRLQRKPDGGA
jgi:putative inorganic carbon (hco3(-)) transporter